MQGGPAAGRRCSDRRGRTHSRFGGDGRCAEQGQAKVDIAQGQADGVAVEDDVAGVVQQVLAVSVFLVTAVDTRKGVEVLPTDGERVHRDAVSGFVHRRASNVAGQFDVLAALADSQVAVQGDKAVNVDVQRTAGLQQVAFGAVQREFELCPGSGGHAQR